MPLLPLDPLIDAALEAALGRDLVLLPTISRPDEDLEIRGSMGESYRKGRPKDR